MGSCILMATLSGFVFDVDDKWIFCEPENESSFGKYFVPISSLISRNKLIYWYLS